MAVVVPSPSVNDKHCLPGRLDDTEGAITTTLETIGGEIADLEANLAQLLI